MVCMPFYKLTVAYDGTNYCGFQVQPNGPTIQGELMHAAIDLFGEGVTVTGASRTDSGVHARGQVVLLKSDKMIEARKVPLAINMRLPDEIVVMACEMVDELWHPRYQEHYKTYQYQVYNSNIQFPQDSRYAYHYRQLLDVEAMKEAASYLVGTHDFESYSSAKKKPQETTVRTITDLTITEADSMIYISVTGDGFLYNMVRIIVGTLFDVGIGKRTSKDVEKSLKERNRQLTGKTAPAKGLTLMRIDYGINGF